MIAGRRTEDRKQRIEVENKKQMTEIDKKAFPSPPAREGFYD
jgi:hypothetical protein